MTDAEALHAEARSRFEAGDLAAARAELERLLRERPDDAELLNDLGTVCFAMGRARESCAYYVRALALDGSRQETRENLAAACRAEGLSWREVLRAAQRNAEGELLVCPCCGGSFRRFLPAGGRRKVPNRKCPGCGSLERHRAIWLYMTNRTNLGRGPIRMLHFAPRPCLQKLLEAMPEVDYVTADLDSPRAALRMDLTDILFRDEVFDAVLCVHVLEHVQDDRRAMREVWRVLKPGGWAVLHSPVDRTREATLEDPGIVSPEDRERLYGQWDHVRAYGRDYARRLAEAGFEVTCDDYLRGLGLEAARRHRLGSELDIYFCVKQGAKAGHAGRL